MAAATQTAGQPSEPSSHCKRKMEDSDTERVSERNSKYALDVDTLDCPICLELLSPPVYQCQNGHTACAACCLKLYKKRCPTCLLSIGSIRCIAIEKVLESLLVSCKYAPDGCKQMVARTDNMHESRCPYEPYRCPVPECDYKGSRVTLPVHLADEHEVRKVALNRISGAGFRMESADRFVMVEGDGEDDELYLVRRMVNEVPFGDVFFCSSLPGKSGGIYNLEVVLCSDDSPESPHSMTKASTVGLRRMQVEYSWTRDFLLLPCSHSDEEDCPVDVHFSLPRED